MDLTADQFEEFYRSIHGHAPFPWQQQIVEEVLAIGEWPQLIDIPTGLGKTSMLDVAVFILAATASQTGPERTGRRRIFFVVDRRIVVDEAREHAAKIAAVVNSAEPANQTVAKVQEALLALAGDDHATEQEADDDHRMALSVTAMRGGLSWEASWIDRPDKAAIVLGTVDQVGSRLFFRGYGCSDGRKPIDAALVGNDSLILVDEAHLATAMTTSIEAAQTRDANSLPLPPVQVVQLSATGKLNDSVFTLDLDAHRQNPIARQRLDAPKELFTVETSATKLTKTLADLAQTAAGMNPEGEWQPVVLVVCNTVARARETYQHLESAFAKGRARNDRRSVELLIGRSRPIDRLDLLETLPGRYGLGRKPASVPRVLVATQTVEVGINLDADVLITEAASWDALVQRLGRLNRSGQFTQRIPAMAAAPAIVVYDGKSEEPVYGESRAKTWEALTSVAPVAASTDLPLEGVTTAKSLVVSPAQCREITRTLFNRPEFMAPRPYIPVLQTPTLDAWTNTAPIPFNDPPVADFLHGIDRGAATVQLVWRDGLGTVNPDGFTPADPETIEAQLGALPPLADEICEIPLPAARRWMRRQVLQEVADIETAQNLDERGKDIDDDLPEIRALVWRSSGPRPQDPRRRGDRRDRGESGGWRWIRASSLKPGDVAIVSSQEGGLDRFGWAPDSSKPVDDVAEWATFRRASRRQDAVTVRIDDGTASRLGLSPKQRSELLAITKDLPNTSDPDVDPETVAQVRRDSAAYLADALGAEEWAKKRGTNREDLVAWFDGQRGPLSLITDFDTDDSWIVGAPRVLSVRLVGASLVERASGGGRSIEATGGNGSVLDDDDSVATSNLGNEVLLSDHLHNVSERALSIAAALGLNEELAEAVTKAALWHDLGKADLRFQASLRSGDRYAAEIGDKPLAKSGTDQRQRSEWQSARARAGLPRGARHEAWSVQVVKAAGVLDDPHSDVDVDLVLHLIGSHHGHSRPWIRPVLDRKPETIVVEVDGQPVSAQETASLVDFDQPRRFVRLNEKYGRWGLALLESIVRCADMTVSAEGK